MKPSNTLEILAVILELVGPFLDPTGNNLVLASLPAIISAIAIICRWHNK
jgi:hypothetical protein